MEREKEALTKFNWAVARLDAAGGHATSAELGERVDARSTVLAARRPEVEPRVAPVDAEPGRLERRQQPGAARAVPLALLADVRLVSERGGHRRLRESGVRGSMRPDS